MTRAILLSVLINCGLFVKAHSLSFNTSSCPLKFQQFPKHAACAQQSQYLVAGGISKTDKKLIVDKHNSYRRNVNPTATDMQLMAWDDELEFVAQRWANSCVLNLVENWELNAIPDRFAYTGHNIAWGFTKWTDVLDAMAGDYETFVYGKPFSSLYLQIIWATTSKVGCGYAVCDIAGSVDTFFVCNYAPGGNYNHGSDAASAYMPYTNGTTCEACPNTCKNGLCDCGGMTCNNGGTLDVNTCTCQCYRTFDYLDNTCNRNCSAAVDDVLCQGQTGVTSYTDSMCSVYINVPYLCPILCDYCPDGAEPYSMPAMTEFDMRSKVTAPIFSGSLTTHSSLSDVITPDTRSPGVASNADSNRPIVYIINHSNTEVQKVVEVAAISGWVIAAFFFCVIIILAAVITVLCHKRKLRRQAQSQAPISGIVNVHQSVNHGGNATVLIIGDKVVRTVSDDGEKPNIYTIHKELKDEKEIGSPQKYIWDYWNDAKAAQELE